MLKRQTACRSDINRMNGGFLATYESLIPAEEEKTKQKQLLALLDGIVSKEWPDARLYVYGSCANSFGFSKSDIDICLAIEDANIDKSEILLKLADMLQSDNLQNVQVFRCDLLKLADMLHSTNCFSYGASFRCDLYSSMVSNSSFLAGANTCQGADSQAYGSQNWFILRYMCE